MGSWIALPLFVVITKLNAKIKPNTKQPTEIMAEAITTDLKFLKRRIAVIAGITTTAEIII
jgi:hypothetical protein